MPFPPTSFVIHWALAAATASTLANGRFSALDRYFTAELAKKSTPSISVAVVERGKLVYAKAFGYADLENRVPATPETVYRIGSITKQFTATMVMQLVNEGKLTVDQTVDSVLPAIPTVWAKVTVRQLLTHTGGVKSYTEVPGLFDDQAMKPTTPEGILKTVEKAPLDFVPGSAWHYSNTGYEILGMIVEKLDGRKFGDSLHVRILDPLGMKNTYFVSERDVILHRAQGYDPQSGGFTHAPYLNMDWPFAAGSMESTALDLAKWDAALCGERVLPQSMLKQMWTPAVLTNGKPTQYGFGWQLDKLNGVDLIQHGGGIHGFTTFIRRAPSKGLTIIVLTNSGIANPQGMATVAMGLVDPTLAVAPPKPIPDHDVAATTFARNLLQSILDGKLDRGTLSPEFAKFLTPDHVSAATQQLSLLGPIGQFVLIQEDVKPSMKTRTYSVTLGSTTFRYWVVVNAAGQVTGFVIHE